MTQKQIGFFIKVLLVLSKEEKNVRGMFLKVKMKSYEK